MLTREQILDAFKQVKGADATEYVLAVGRAVEKAAEAAAIERCAKVCDEWQRAYVLEHCCDLAQDNALKSVAAAIRALLPKEE